MAPARPLVTPLMLAAGCVALADWLFYGWPIGISLALFFGIVGIDQEIHAARTCPADWRGWGFRTWRLDRYLANNPSIPPKLSDDSGKG